MWKAVRGRLGLKKIVFKVTEKKGDPKKKKDDDKKDQQLLDKNKGSGLTDAEVAVMCGPARRRTRGAPPRPLRACAVHR